MLECSREVAAGSGILPRKSHGDVASFIVLHCCENLGSVCIATRRVQEAVKNWIVWELIVQVTDNRGENVRNVGIGTRV